MPFFVNAFNNLDEENNSQRFTSSGLHKKPNKPQLNSLAQTEPEK